MALKSRLEIPGFCDGTSLKMPGNSIVSPMNREEPNGEFALWEQYIVS